MIIDCPKCREAFELSSRSFREERFDVSSYLACPICGWLLPSLEFVGEPRWGEFLDWVNDYNRQLVVNRGKEKKKWEVVVYDRDLRLQLVKEGLLSGAAGDPSIHLHLCCVDPDKTYVLKRFREYTMKEWKHGFINPVIRIQPASVITNADEFITL